jgi:hypothetical protein
LSTLWPWISIAGVNCSTLDVVEQGTIGEPQPALCVATISNAFSSAERYDTVSSVLPTYEVQTNWGVAGNGSLKTGVGTDDRIVKLFKVLVGVPD